MPQRLEPDYLLLGKVLRPHGVRGELKVSILTDYPERLRELDAIFIGSGVDDPAATPYHIQAVRFHQGYALIKFKEVPDRNAAERFRELFVMIDTANAVPLEENEFYLYQLIGLNVQTDSGQPLGTIAEVLETGANDVYVLQSDQYGELLIPAHDETIIKIDFKTEIVTVKLPDGLLPDG